MRAYGVGVLFFLIDASWVRELQLMYDVVITHGKMFIS